MDDITPLNLEDSPKLFGLRYDQLFTLLGTVLGAMQLYTYLNPIMFGTHDLRVYLCIFIGMIGPVYCLLTLNHSTNYWETLLNFYVGNRIFVPGPDPNPQRFLLEEPLPDFTE